MLGRVEVNCYVCVPKGTYLVAEVAYDDRDNANCTLCISYMYISSTLSTFSLRISRNSPRKYTTQK